MLSVTLVTLAAVAMGVFAVMLLTAAMSHRSRRQARAPAGSLVLELIWSVVPWLIVAAAVSPAVIEIMRDSHVAPVQARVLEIGEN